MNREDYLNELIPLAKVKKNLFIQWPTGTGKSRGALEIIKKYCISPYDTGVIFPKYLIVVPKLILIDNWKVEIIKWLGEDKLPFFSFVTYVSLYKEMGYVWDCIVFDEGHHFTERCAEVFMPQQARRIILLSATVKREVRERLSDSIPDLWYYRVSTRSVIEDKILPDPTVFLIPLSLDELKGQYTYVKNPKGKGKFRVSFDGRWAYMRRKERVEIICTARQCHSLYYENVKFWENQFKKTHQMWAHSKWMHYAGERLKWLSEIKTPIVKDILRLLENYRTLTFCSSITQTEELGKNYIHSKGKQGGDANLKAFNEGRVNHITACAILDEGVNLTSCQVGIFAGLNASEVKVKQRLGRILRHPHPLIILPYFVGTRDEEIINEMKQDYNPELTHIVTRENLENEISKFIAYENCD